MCMFCAAIPVIATTGVVLDRNQRRKMQAQGRPLPRLRPFPLLTVGAILLLIIGSALSHFFYLRL